MEEQTKKEKALITRSGKYSAADITLDQIREMQDAWAKMHPQKAHEVYPDVYKSDGSRISDG